MSQCLKHARSIFRKNVINNRLDSWMDVALLALANSTPHHNNCSRWEVDERSMRGRAATYGYLSIGNAAHVLKWSLVQVCKRALTGERTCPRMAAFNDTNPPVAGQWKLLAVLLCPHVADMLLTCCWHACGSFAGPIDHAYTICNYLFFYK